jgi:hypothetical protein
MRALEFLAILALVHTAVCDISIHNTYFTDTTTVYDNVELGGIEYSNGVSIDNANIYVYGYGWSKDGVEGLIDNEVTLASDGDIMSGRFGARSSDVGYAKSIVAGNSDYVKIEYGVGSGQAIAGGSSMYTSGLQRLAIENMTYSGSVSAVADTLDMGGSVTRIPEGQNDTKDVSFRQYLTVQRGDKWATIESYIATKKGNETKSDMPIIAPVFRFDDSITGSKDEATIAGAEINVLAGDRNTTVYMNGNSSSLSQKHHGPVVVPKMPVEELESMDLDQIAAIRITEKLYMTYKLDI